MSNTNPVPGRLAKRNRKASGDVEQLRELVWRVVVKLEQHIAKSDVGDPDVIKVCNSLAQMAPVYLKTVEVGEIEGRIQMLEGKQ